MISGLERTAYVHFKAVVKKDEVSSYSPSNLPLFIGRKLFWCLGLRFPWLRRGIVSTSCELVLEGLKSLVTEICSPQS